MNCPKCGHDIYLVEVLRREITWVEVKSGNKPICKTIGREKVWFVEAGEKYRICHVDGISEAKYDQWKTA
jgi:hypothetical protein